MRRIQKWGIALAAITAGTQLNTTEACTRVVYQGKDNTVLTARSMDWKEDTRSNLWIFPRGMKRNGEIGKNPLEWTSKYGSVVASAYDICSTDGMNEKGLVANLLWLAESEYPQWMVKNRDCPLPPGFNIYWIISPQSMKQFPMLKKAPSKLYRT